MPKSNGEVQNELPQDRKLETEIKNEPADPRQIGSSIVRRNETDDED